MVIVVQVKLQPTPDQFRALAKTLAACNAAACRASKIAFEAGGATGPRKIRRAELQVLAYHEMKQTLSAQPAVRTIAKVVDAYATLRSNLRNGNYGKPGSLAWTWA